ncbi:MAG: GTP 3',8-cyclase MoaA [Desulfamplus sp.]|nr:GTP 3',8-cyclase MoaA [Desulfamplus sp.]
MHVNNNIFAENGTISASQISEAQRAVTVDNRIINYLRISITDRCNLACQYCVPKETLPALSHESIARYEEIHKIVVCASQLGISKLRITGGEPLLRKGVFSFLKGLSQIEGINDISITTNGVLLESHIDEILAAGVNRINISLDTLKPDRFRAISGKDLFETVWRGIMASLDRGLTPIKLNAVILRGINDDEIEDLARLSVIYPFHVRFIEYMPMGNSAVDISQQVLIPEIRQRIEHAIGKLEPVTRGMLNAKSSILDGSSVGGSGSIGSNSGYIGAHEAGPAKRYKIEGALGEIGFISPVSSHFCHECNRLRLTSTGHLRPCLLNNREIDVLTPLRQGASNEAIKKLFLHAIQSKPAAHSLHDANDNGNINNDGIIVKTLKCNRVDTQMSTIGG